MSLQDDIFDVEAVLDIKDDKGAKEAFDRVVTALGNIEEERDQLVSSTNVLLNFRDLLLGPLVRRVEALEKHSHEPVMTYKAEDIDKMIDDLRERVHSLENQYED